MTARYRAVFLAAIENNRNFSLSPYSDTKITVKQEKTATEVLLLRFRRGVTGTTFKESNERLTMLMY